MIFSIEDCYSQNESQIDDITKCAKDGADEYDGEPYPCHFRHEKYFQKDGQYVKITQEKKWSDMKKDIGEQLNQIYEQTQSQFKKTEWYCTFGKINNVYQKTMIPYWFEGKYFLKGQVCFICLKEDHRIDFDCHTMYQLIN